MSIELIDKIKPKNNGGFPLIDAEDVEMPDGTRLSEYTQGGGQSGEPGKDGVSATHSWNGTVLTITSASGTSSADLKGDPGEKGDKGDKGDTGATGAQGEPGQNGKDGADGKTPVKGTDYWTAADKLEIASELYVQISSLFVPVTQEEYDAMVAAGTVDPNKYYMIVG